MLGIILKMELTLLVQRDMAEIILKIELFLISNKGISKDNSEVSS